MTAFDHIDCNLKITKETDGAYTRYTADATNTYHSIKILFMFLTMTVKNKTPAKHIFSVH